MCFCNCIALWFVMLSHLMTYTNSEYRMMMGGSIDSNIGEHPYLVAILYDNKPHCVGSLISLPKVVTAANCVAHYPENSFTVVAGTTNLCHMDEHAQIRNVKKIFYSHDHFPESRDMRIAVVEVHRSFDQGPTVRAIEYRGCIFPEPTSMEVAGWGHTTTENGITSNILQSTVLTLTRGEINFLTQCGILTRRMSPAVFDTRVADVEFIGAPGVVDGKLCAMMLYNLGDTSGFVRTYCPDRMDFLDTVINC